MIGAYTGRQPVTLFTVPSVEGALDRGGRRGAAESRLSRRDDGKSEYLTKKGVTSEQLVRRLLWLIPPARFHLTSFHGVRANRPTAIQGNAARRPVTQEHAHPVECVSDRDRLAFQALGD